MNSNNDKKDKKAVKNFIAFRPTFGVICKATGLKYPDVQLAFLAPLFITCTDFDHGFIYHNAEKYILHCDKPVRVKLGMEGYCKVLVSFQIRTNGAFAIARLYKEKEGN